MRQFSDGSVYLNFPGFFEEGDEMMRTTFGSAYERLVALKDEYDPTNVFSRNQNVPPSETARAGGGKVMSDHADSAAVASTFSSVQVVLVSVLAASVGVVLATRHSAGTDRLSPRSRSCSRRR